MAKRVDKESRRSHWDRWVGGGGIQKGETRRCIQGSFLDWKNARLLREIPETLPHCLPFLVPKADEVEVGCSTFNACCNAQEERWIICAPLGQMPGCTDSKVCCLACKR